MLNSWASVTVVDVAATVIAEVVTADAHHMWAASVSLAHLTAPAATLPFVQVR